MKLGSNGLKLDRTANKLNLSKLYEVHKGGFGFIDKDGITTYTISHRIDDLIDDLVTFEKLTSDKQWPVSQIIQREIDEQRVRNIAHQYITKPDSIKYFPPITVVLLPIEDGTRHIAKSFRYDDEGNDNDYRRMITQKWAPIIGGQYNDLLNYINNGKNESIAEGLYELLIDENFGYRLLAWDNTKYSAVVIDGQHRLEALKIAVSENSEYSSFIQDVVIIDISKRVKVSKLTPVELVRKIFIDINSNAEEVSSARKYVMDDKDLASLFVQTIVNDDDPDNTREGKFIPPQLIDWHAENLKHELPHTTGIMVLYQLMADYVLNGKNLISIDDLRHSRKVENWVEYLNSNFKVDHLIKSKIKYKNVKKISDSLEYFKKEILSLNGTDDNEIQNLESYLFQFDYHILKIAQEYFEENYSKAIVMFFTSLKPYKDIISSLKSEGVFDQDNNYYKLVVTHPKKIKGDEKELINNLKNKLRKESDDKYYLVLTVLGQKSIFSMFFNSLMSSMQSGVSESLAIKSANDFILGFNNLFEIFSYNEFNIFAKDRTPCVEQRVLDKYRINMYGKQASHFWEDIVYKDTSIIYNSQGISSLRQTFEYMLLCIGALNENANLVEFGFEFNPNYVKSRIKRRIENEHQKSPDEAAAAAEDILKAKKEFIDSFVRASFSAYKLSEKNRGN